LARCSSEDLRSLSKISLQEAKLNRMAKSANLRKHMRQLKDELWDVRSELAEIDHLLMEMKTLQFPGVAPAVEEAVPPVAVKRRA
jgi:hypothetical protein